LKRFCTLLTLAVLTFAARAELPDPTAFGVAMELGRVDQAAAWLDGGMPPDYLADRIGSGLMIGAWEGNVPLMELFLKHGADVNFRNANDEQALQLAAWKGQTRAVEWLLAHGARLDNPGQGWSALHYAVFAGHAELAKLLLARGANVNALAPNGSSVLMMAAREGHEDLAKLLLNAGADPTVRNEWGDSALTWAMRQGNLRIARMVASEEQFAEAARMPPQSFGQAIRSVPPPGRIGEILKQIRLAEAQGRPTAALRKLFFDAVAEFKRDAPGKTAARTAKPKGPAALMITAERRKPGAERAEVVYAPPAPAQAPTLAPTPPSAPVTGDPADLLKRIREAEAKGKPTSELRRAFLDAVQRFKGERGSLP